MRHLVPILIAATLLGLSGCDDTVFDPFLNEDRYFTVWGYLNERESNHRLRVVPVTRQAATILSPTAPNATLDAFVRTIDLDTGETVQWVHSLEQLSDETWGHVFRANFFVEAGHRYRLVVERNDGIQTTAETNIPSQGSKSAILSSPIVIGDSVYQDIVLPGVRFPWKMDLAYSLNPTMLFDYRGNGEPDGDGGWRIRANLTRDFEEILNRLGVSQEFGLLILNGIGVRIEMLDDQWELPGGGFDPTRLEQPGTRTNVENGYGYFGSIGPFLDDWVATAEVKELLRR